MRKLLLVFACALLAGCGSTRHAITGAAGAACKTVEMPITGTRNEDPPLRKLNVDKTYDVTFATSCGNFTVRLDPAASPNATASIVSLVDHLYYDTTVFHRIWVGTLIQGGDPTGSGTGGPGYTTVDTVPKTAGYTRGVVAMAKTGAERSGTAGGQFFVVTGANAGLNPDYAIVGRVIKGMDAVERIGRLGHHDQTPTQIVELISATLTIS